MKKTKKETFVIKELLSKCWSQIKIAKFLKLSKQRVKYLANHQIKLSKNRKTKLKYIYIARIIRWAKNKRTNSMSCRKISSIVNNILKLRKELDNKGNIISISYKMDNKILKDYYKK